MAEPDLEPDQLTQDLCQLVNDKLTADVLFIVGKDEIPLYAHKLMLWARYVGVIFLYNIGQCQADIWMTINYRY